MLASGAVSDQLLQAADHEADLLGHPYIGVEHLELGRLFWFHTGDVAKA
jgi:hypothetical protein